MRLSTIAEPVEFIREMSEPSDVAERSLSAAVTADDISFHRRSVCFLSFPYSDAETALPMAKDEYSFFCEPHAQRETIMHTAESTAAVFFKINPRIV